MFVASYYVSTSRLFKRLTDASLMVVYSSGAGVVTNGRLRQRKASFPTITMNVTAICAFAWTRRYAALRSVFPIRMNFEGHLMRMDAIMWGVLRSYNPYKRGCRVSFGTRLFMDSPEGPR